MRIRYSKNWQATNPTHRVHPQMQNGTPPPMCILINTNPPLIYRKTPPSPSETHTPRGDISGENGDIAK